MFEFQVFSFLQIQSFPLITPPPPWVQFCACLVFLKLFKRLFLIIGKERGYYISAPHACSERDKEPKEVWHIFCHVVNDINWQFIWNCTNIFTSNFLTEYSFSRIKKSNISFFFSKTCGNLFLLVNHACSVWRKRFTQFVPISSLFDKQAWCKWPTLNVIDYFHIFPVVQFSNYGCFLKSCFTIEKTICCYNNTFFFLSNDANIFTDPSTEGVQSVQNHKQNFQNKPKDSN